VRWQQLSVVIRMKRKVIASIYSVYSATAMIGLYTQFIVKLQ
jgi:hypothetical protein